MQLATTPFEAICSGRKVIESRLYDKKRQLIRVGDEIVFTNQETRQTCSVRVTGLLRYDTFHNLFTHHEPTKFGGETAEQLEKQINLFYSPAEQRQYSVVGIEFELI